MSLFTLDSDECIRELLEGSLDLRALTNETSREASSDWKPPTVSGPAGKLVNECLLVFNFTMQARRSYSAYVCVWVMNPLTEGRRGSLFVHKCKFRMLNPCYVNETKTSDPAGEIGLLLSFYVHSSWCWKSCSSLCWFLNKQSVNSLHDWRTWHRFVVS